MECLNAADVELWEGVARGQTKRISFRIVVKFNIGHSHVIVNHAGKTSVLEICSICDNESEEGSIARPLSASSTNSV